MSRYEESSFMELKRQINTEFKKEVIAFANTDGGEIIIGVEKDGTVVGVANIDEVMAQAGNMIRDGIKPDLTAFTTIEAIADSQKRLVHVSVLRGAKRPYHLADKGLKPSGVFVRHGVSSVPATDEGIRQMLRESDSTEFDQSRSAKQDLTFTYTENYFNKSNIGFTDANKRSLGLMDSDGYYTNIGLLLSDQCLHSIKCAVFEGAGKTTFKSRKEFFGSILKQMDDVYDYLDLNNNLNSTFDGLKRIDHPDYPEYSLRESLLNTIVHRDYNYSGSTIINIFDNRVEFVSLGGLVKGITLDDIMGGVSQPRNTAVANVFYRLELIEAYGTGIQRIIENYNGYLQKPSFRPAPSSFVVTLPKIDRSMSPSAIDGPGRERLLLNHIRQNDGTTRKEAELYLGITKLSALRILNKLISDGKIVKTGAAKAVLYRAVDSER